MGRFRIPMVEITDVRGTATREVDNVAVATVSALGRDAKVREGVLDRTGTHTTRRPRTALPADADRHVRRRDRHCRILEPTAPTASSATPKTPPA